MKVIILAAGKGERLLPLTRNTPKSLLELGNGMTILENQLAAIKSSGIDQVVIVTGYKPSRLKPKLKITQTLILRLYIIHFMTFPII